MVWYYIPGNWLWPSLNKPHTSMFPQMVLGEDGGYGTVLEHSALDGPPGVFTNIMTMDFIERYEYHFKIQCI